jgi:hypothetical protein
LYKKAKRKIHLFGGWKGGFHQGIYTKTSQVRTPESRSLEYNYIKAADTGQHGRKEQ